MSKTIAQRQLELGDLALFQKHNKEYWLAYNGDGFVVSGQVVTPAGYEPLRYMLALFDAICHSSDKHDMHPATFVACVAGMEARDVLRSGLSGVEGTSAYQAWCDGRPAEEIADFPWEQ